MHHAQGHAIPYMLHPSHAEDTLSLVAEEDWRCYEEDCLVPQTGHSGSGSSQQASLAPLRGSAAAATAQAMERGMLDPDTLSLEAIMNLPVLQRSRIFACNQVPKEGAPGFVSWYSPRAIVKGE